MSSVVRRQSLVGVGERGDCDTGESPFQKLSWFFCALDVKQRYAGPRFKVSSERRVKQVKVMPILFDSEKEEIQQPDSIG